MILHGITTDQLLALTLTMPIILYVRQLLEELKQLNKELVQKRGQPGPRKVSQLSKHLDKFSATNAAVLGKGAGYLSVGVAAGLLVQLGIGREVRPVSRSR